MPNSWTGWTDSTKTCGKTSLKRAWSGTGGLKPSWWRRASTMLTSSRVTRCHTKSTARPSGTFCPSNSTLPISLSGITTRKDLRQEGDPVVLSPTPHPVWIALTTGQWLESAKTTPVSSVLTVTSATRTHMLEWVTLTTQTRSARQQWCAKSAEHTCAVIITETASECTTHVWNMCDTAVTRDIPLMSSADVYIDIIDIVVQLRCKHCVYIYDRDSAWITLKWNIILWTHTSYSCANRHLFITISRTQTMWQTEFLETVSVWMLPGTSDCK